MKHVLLFLTLATTASAAETVRVVVRETGGLDRASYPAHGKIKLAKPVPPNTAFRMLHKGRPVVAQFRPERPGKTTDTWWVDLPVYLRPLETRRYRIKYGGDVKPGPQRRGGHVLKVTPKNFVVSNAPYIDWTIPKDLKGLLKSVNFRPSEHLRPDSRGLMLRDAKGKVHQLGGKGTKATVVRHGRMTVALRFEGTETKAELAGVRWTVDLIFPGPVSWVEVRLGIHDPDHKATFAGLNFNLNLDKPASGKPTLAEFGASSIVYTYLYGRDEMHLRAHAKSKSPWQVLRGSPKNLLPFAVAPPGKSGPAEGWAHIMDRKRCLGLSVHRFAQTSPEMMSLSAGGDFTAWKQLPKNKNGRHQWRSWYHFLHFPHHSSARASPQQMQHPIVFRQIR